MTKVILPDVASGFNLQIINDNFQKIEQELQDKVLYRDNPLGEPNSLETDIDMNSKRLFNLPAPTIGSEAARLQDVQEAIAGANAANLTAFSPYGTIASTNVQGGMQELNDDFTQHIANLAAANGVLLVGNAADKRDLSASTGAGLLGYTSLGAGAVASTVRDVLREGVSVCNFLSLAQVADAISGANALDCTAGVQAAIDYCLANNRNLKVPYLFKISQCLINRLVDAATNEFYFTIMSDSGGGFISSTATEMFSSSLAFTAAPVSHLVRWDGIKFVGANIATASYVIDAKKFLRIQYNNCTFYNIKHSQITGAGQYYQSYALNNCFAQGWSGSFMKTSLGGVSDGAYDIQVIGGLYQAGVGQHCFDIERVNNGKFWTTIVNCSGTAVKINGPKGVDICGYFETNGLDIDFRTGGVPAAGVNIHGCTFLVSNPAVFTVKWGTALGCVSRGNVHYGSMHDLQSDSVVDINDQAYTAISNSGDVVYTGGYREKVYTGLTLRAGSSAAYTTTPISGRYTRSGNRVNLEFIATLTSTGTNGADFLFINGGLPFAAKAASFLCGTVQVVGSATNNGISPLTILAASPMTALSALTVIPANTTGNSWTVLIQMSYVAV